MRWQSGRTASERRLLRRTGHSSLARLNGRASYEGMNALILYNQIGWLRNASQLLRRAGANATPGESWSVQPWRTDIIRFPAAAEAALAEAIDSDLIVLAGLGIDSLAGWVGEWLQRWVLLRKVEDAALVVINGGDSEGLIVQTAPWLTEFAACHGLALISNDSDASISTGRQRLGAPLCPTSEVGHNEPNWNWQKGQELRVQTHGTNQ